MRTTYLLDLSPIHSKLKLTSSGDWSHYTTFSSQWSTSSYHWNILLFGPFYVSHSCNLEARHWTWNRIVIITSVVVAATAAAVRDRFDKYSQIGGIIGSSVSAGFLIILGIMNVFILYKLVTQLKGYLRNRRNGQEAIEGIEFTGTGCLFGLMKSMFKMIDRSVFL